MVDCADTDFAVVADDSADFLSDLAAVTVPVQQPALSERSWNQKMGEWFARGDVGKIPGSDPSRLNVLCGGDEFLDRGSLERDGYGSPAWSKRGSR